MIITTRFPRNAAFRFGQELDFDEWRQRLIIHGLDLRDLAGLDQFIAELRNTELDILIHNAAQTIRRAPAFYEHLREIESRALPASEEALVHRCAVPAYDRFISGDHAWLPAGLLDSDGQQIDLSPANSWTARAGDVSTIELLETMLVSQSAPFLLSNRLRPQMARSSQSPRFIVNVSAMEGQFQRDSKTPCHPHTNMAKAALNMFTRTSAQDFMTDEIWMNSVDTGWITDENPFPKKTRLLDEHHFIPPLDAIDGMARIYDPIVRGRAEPKQKLFGQFLKDYQPHPW